MINNTLNRQFIKSLSEKDLMFIKINIKLLLIRKKDNYLMNQKNHKELFVFIIFLNRLILRWINFDDQRNYY